MILSRHRFRSFAADTTVPFLDLGARRTLGLNDGNDYWNNIWREHQESRGLYTVARLN